MALALGACSKETSLAGIPCSTEQECAPYGLFCDVAVGQCALCTSDSADCPGTGNGGAAGSSSSQGGAAGSGAGGDGPVGGSGGTGADGGRTGNGGSGASGAATGSGGSGGDAGAGSTGGSGLTGGSSGDGGSGNAGGAGGTSGDPPCMPAIGSASNLIIYSGGAGACTDRLDAPRTGFWFAFNDETGLQVPGSTDVHNGILNGRGGASDCMMRSQGAAFSGWGGSVKFWINAGGGQVCTYDASAYSGIRFYIRGSTSGTSGASFAAANNTVRVNVPTQSTSGSDQKGTCLPTSLPCNDSYGKWCSLSSDWTLCELPFGGIAQVGWGVAALFTPSEILGLQIQASRLDQAGVTASWDLYIDDVTFY